MGNNLTSLLDLDEHVAERSTSEARSETRREESQPELTNESQEFPIPGLPFELLGVIAQHLVAEDQYGTCASLALSCKASYHECAPRLYARFVVWGAKVYANIAATLLDRGMLGSIFDQREARIKREAKKEWEGFKMSSVGNHAQFIFVPFPMVEPQPRSSASSPKAVPSIASRGFPKLKASTQISLWPAEGGGIFDMHTTVMVILFEGFQYASRDIHGLSQALKLLVDRGGPAVENAFEGPNGITIFPRSAKTADQHDELDAAFPSLAEAIERVSNLPTPSRGYKPYIVYIRANDRVSYQSIALMFLDVLFWMKAEGTTEERPTIVVCDDRAESFAACAKAYQEATKAVPSLLRVFLRFNLSCHAAGPDTVSHMESVVDIFRNAFCTTPEPINLQDLGVLAVKITAETGARAWIIYADWHNDKILATSMVNGAVEVLHEDAWTAKKVPE